MTVTLETDHPKDVYQLQREHRRRYYVDTLAAIVKDVNLEKEFTGDQPLFFVVSTVLAKLRFDTGEVKRRWLAISHQSLFDPEDARQRDLKYSVKRKPLWIVRPNHRHGRAERSGEMVSVFSDGRPHTPIKARIKNPGFFKIELVEVTEGGGARRTDIEPGRYVTIEMVRMDTLPLLYENLNEIFSELGMPAYEKPVPSLQALAKPEVG